MRLGLLIFILHLPLFAHADSVAEIARLRLKNGYWMGPRVTLGSISARADGARTEVELTSILGLQGGLEFWPTDTMGVKLDAEIGLPAQIENVLDNRVGYSRHTIHSGLYYRSFFGPRAKEGAVFFGSVIDVSVEDVQEQRPSVLVSRTIFAPGVRVGYEGVVLDGNAWWRAQAGIGYPFFVRETPTDSGRPDAMYDLRIAAEICYYVSSTWGINLQSLFVHQQFDHGGEATRAGGVVDVSVEDSYLSFLLGIRRVLSD